MTYQQFLHLRIAGYLCGLRSGGMERLFSTRSGILGESGLMEKQIDSFYLFRYGGKINRIRTIGITPRDSRGTGETVASLARTIRERVEAGLVDPQDLLMAEVKQIGRASCRERV